MSLHLSEIYLCDSCYTVGVSGFIPSLVLLPRDTLADVTAFIELHLVSLVFITCYVCCTSLHGVFGTNA